jgi:hypothetical protein
LRRAATLDEAVGLGDVDVVLLDLYSSTSPGREHRVLSEATLSPSLRRALRTLREAHGEHSVPVSQTQVVAFSIDSSGVSARTLLRAFGAADYFFKEAAWSNQKPLYYASFRNALVVALHRDVAHILGLPGPDAPGHGHTSLVAWLRQFWTCDRPQVLRMMGRFRYYSARSMVGLLDGALMPPGAEAGDLTVLGVPVSAGREMVISYLGRPNKSGPATLSLLAKTRWMEMVIQKMRLERPELMRTYDQLGERIRESVHNGKELLVLLVDDFVGSGGQCAEYLAKFVRKHLVEEVCEEERPTMARALLLAHGAGNAHPSVEFRCMFVAGVPNEAFSQTVAPCVQEDHFCRGHIVVGCDYGDLSVPIHVIDWAESAVVDQRSAEVLERYRGIAKVRSREYACSFEPLGWKSTGALMATYANAPGNAPPVIWGHGRRWRPLFERFFNPFDDGDAKSCATSRFGPESILDADGIVALLCDDPSPTVAHLRRRIPRDQLTAIARLRQAGTEAELRCMLSEMLEALREDEALWDERGFGDWPIRGETGQLIGQTAHTRRANRLLLEDVFGAFLKRCEFCTGCVRTGSCQLDPYFQPCKEHVCKTTEWEMRPYRDD